MKHTKGVKERNRINAMRAPVRDAAFYRAQAGLHKAKLRRTRRIFLQSGLFLLAALIVAVLSSLAWFAINTGVFGSTSHVSSKKHATRLASKGERLKEEIEELDLAVGTPFYYHDETYYYTEDGEIALRFAEKQSVSPGARGQVDFYLIPGENSPRQETLCINLSCYQKGEGEGGRATPAEDAVLNRLLGGHILLFAKYEDGFFSELLLDTQAEEFPHNRMTVTISEDAKADEPIPIRIYWVWPKRYENLISQRSGKGDIFAPESAEYEDVFAPLLEAQNQKWETVSGTSEHSDYSYNAFFLAGGNLPNTTETREKAYNLADEYIGTNADYLYLTISTQHRD